MRQTDFRPSALPIPLALILAIGARPAAGQIHIPTAVGPENIGCATPPIDLVVSTNPLFGPVMGPSPAGYGLVNGIFLFWPGPTLAPFPLPMILLPAAAGFGASGACCSPGPATIYSAASWFVSIFEFGVIAPYDSSLYGQQVWIQELIVRPASPFVPCTVYVTNQKLWEL